ncbi:MAG: lipocalin family protein [Planctomycetota bacterium]
MRGLVYAVIMRLSSLIMSHSLLHYPGRLVFFDGWGIQPFPRIRRVVVLVGISLLLEGCSRLTGTWTQETSTQQGDGIPLRHVTFDEKFGFTATFEDDQNMRTSTGSYTWNGFRLGMTFQGDSAPSYGGRKGTKGKLIVVRLRDEDTPSAVFVRIRG